MPNVQMNPFTNFFQAWKEDLGKNNFSVEFSLALAFRITGSLTNVALDIRLAM